MKLAQTALALLEDTRWFLDVLNKSQYSQALPILSNSSIGQHTRHFIEFFECLLDREDSITVCYDKRKRDYLLETDSSVAKERLNGLQQSLKMLKEDQALKLSALYPESGEVWVDSSLKRELMYNIEHTIHHLAIIKIGLLSIDPALRIPEHFGIAASTRKYRAEQCVR